MEDNSRRFTTVHDRFQVSDECCGMVETAMTLKDALKIAESHAKKHSRETDSTVKTIIVWDVMARKNQPHEWHVDVPA